MLQPTGSAVCRSTKLLEEMEAASGGSPEQGSPVHGAQEAPGSEQPEDASLQAPLSGRKPGRPAMHTGCQVCGVELEGPRIKNFHKASGCVSDPELAVTTPAPPPACPPATLPVAALSLPCPAALLCSEDTPLGGLCPPALQPKFSPSCTAGYRRVLLEATYLRGACWCTVRPADPPALLLLAPAPCLQRYHICESSGSAYAYSKQAGGGHHVLHNA